MIWVQSQLPPGPRACRAETVGLDIGCALQPPGESLRIPPPQPPSHQLSPSPRRSVRVLVKLPVGPRAARMGTQGSFPQGTGIRGQGPAVTHSFNDGTATPHPKPWARHSSGLRQSTVQGKCCVFCAEQDWKQRWASEQTDRQTVPMAFHPPSSVLPPDGFVATV